MKRENGQFEKNISRLVKRAGDAERPRKRFVESLIDDALGELGQSAREGTRGRGGRIMNFKKILAVAAMLAIVCTAAVVMVLNSDEGSSGGSAYVSKRPATAPVASAPAARPLTEAEKAQLKALGYGESGGAAGKPVAKLAPAKTAPGSPVEVVVSGERLIVAQVADAEAPRLSEADRKKLEAIGYDAAAGRVEQSRGITVTNSSTFASPAQVEQYGTTANGEPARLFVKDESGAARRLGVSSNVTAYSMSGVWGQPIDGLGGVAPIPLVLPKPMFVGTPQSFSGVQRIEKPLGGPRPPFLAPVGTRNVALGRPVTASDSEPIIGELEMITDGDKDAADGSYVELGPFAQHVTVDLGERCNIYAIVVWHYHKQARVYFDVAVQAADDADFITNVRTLFNNDDDNSLGLGVGQDMHYVETNEGKLIDAKGVQAKYVRLWSNGNSSNDLNNYVEVEVYGIPVAEGAKDKVGDAKLNVLPLELPKPMVLGTPQSVSGVVCFDASDPKAIVAGQAGRLESLGYAYGVLSAPVQSYVVRACAPGKCPMPTQQKRGYYPPAHGGTRPPNGEAVDAMFFKDYGVNPFVDTEDDHLSTFATDVDTGAYTVCRGYLRDGHVPPDEAVRVEEFVNYFDYGYEAPQEDVFAIYTEAAPWSFGEGRKNSYLMRIGLKGRQVSEENRKPCVLTFVIDVSGSMNRENRLGLVKRSLRMLVEKLREGDYVGIAVYGSNGREFMAHRSMREKDFILRKIESLCAGGSTYAEEGIRIGYEMAEGAYREGYVNRVILCSDGVANVGKTGADDILKVIKAKASEGITLSAIGYGMGNYNDVLMERLGDNGNGHYAYVDTIEEARRLFEDNLTGTLQVIGRDVKVQVDFNPEVVRSYRLIGYENRDVPDEKFRDDKYDGGEVGAGHSVTALYELKLWPDKEGLVATTYVRYKDADTYEVAEFARSFDTDDIRESLDGASAGFRLAATVGEFAEILRKSYWAKGATLDSVLSNGRELRDEFEDDDDVAELVRLISRAKGLGCDSAAANADSEDFGDEFNEG